MLPTRQLRGTTSTLAYLVLLHVEIARFTRTAVAAACAASTAVRLVSVALILTSRWTVVSCYVALCSPDVPPVRPFGTCTSDGLANFTVELSRTGVFPASKSKVPADAGTCSSQGRPHCAACSAAIRSSIGGGLEDSLPPPHVI